MSRAIRTAYVLVAVVAVASLLLVLVFLANAVWWMLLPVWLTALLFGIFVLVDRLVGKPTVRLLSKLALWAVLTAAIVIIAT